MKVILWEKEKAFIDFEVDLTLWERIQYAYAIIRNFTINFKFKRHNLK